MVTALIFVAWWLVGYAICLYDFSGKFDISLFDMVLCCFFACFGPINLLFAALANWADWLMTKKPIVVIKRRKR